MNIIILGKPGAGKGTQSEIICKEFDLYHLSTGDLFRANLEHRTELGEKIRSYMNSPNLISDEIVNEVVSKEISARNYNNIVFDGYPRTIFQAEFLEGELDYNHVQIILLDVSDSIAINRIKKRQRLEDRTESNSLEKIKGRINEYKRLTEPIVERYSLQERLIVLDGEEDIETVAYKLKNTINLAQVTIR